MSDVPPIDVGRDARLGRLDRLSAAAGPADGAHHHLRRLRQSAARPRPSVHHGGLAADARRVGAGRLVRLRRDDDWAGGGGRRRRSPRPAHGAPGSGAGLRPRHGPDLARPGHWPPSACSASSPASALAARFPTRAALAAEYVPRQQRPIAVTLAIVCVPLGGTLAGLFAVPALPAFGWRGLVPHRRRACLPSSRSSCSRLLPESPLFLARRPGRHRELARLLAAYGAPGPRRRHLRQRGRGHSAGARQRHRRCRRRSPSRLDRAVGRVPLVPPRGLPRLQSGCRRCSPAPTSAPGSPARV